MESCPIAYRTIIGIKGQDARSLKRGTNAKIMM
jgi:hypothetical protein